MCPGALHQLAFQQYLRHLRHSALQFARLENRSYAGDRPEDDNRSLYASAVGGPLWVTAGD
jgi:hypothetical protein